MLTLLLSNRLLANSDLNCNMYSCLKMRNCLNGVLCYLVLSPWVEETTNRQNYVIPIIFLETSPGDYINYRQGVFRGSPIQTKFEILGTLMRGACDPRLIPLSPRIDYKYCLGNFNFEGLLLCLLIYRLIY